MFEDLDREENGGVAVADPIGKVTLPPRAEGEDAVRQARYRVTLPRQNNFFEEYPRKWTWESWAKRIEQEWLMVARSVESVIWATIGALLGVALTAVPGAFIEAYHYVIWQPLGAAAGAAIGAAIVWRRWQGVFDSHQDISR